MYAHLYTPIPTHLSSLLPWQPVGTPDHWSRQHETLRPPAPYAHPQSCDLSATLGGETKVMHGFQTSRYKTICELVGRKEGGREGGREGERRREKERGRKGGRGRKGREGGF